jgi:WYL domain-containing protein
MNKQKIVEALKEGVVSVTFTKVSGTVRMMNATLNDEYLPALVKEDTTDAPKRVHNDDVCVVWSVDDNGWRSFRWDSLTDWSVNV